MLRQKLDFACHVEEGLPPALGDADAVQRVLDNLIANAAKFTPRGGRVSLRAFRAGEQAAVEVSDTGLGIPESDLPHIFERFYRIHRPGREIPGTGLGLSIVQEIVRLHGGRVTVCSEVDKGKRVYRFFCRFMEKGLHRTAKRG